jgi:hypothetical protein
MHHPRLGPVIERPIDAVVVVDEAYVHEYLQCDRLGHLRILEVRTLRTCIKAMG